MVDYAAEVKPDLAIVGPEEPLWVGLVDALEEQLSIPTFGPYKNLAKIETSKSWARDFIRKYEDGVNPDYKIFDSNSIAGLRGFLQGLGEYVIKPDGLTGGKGVRVSGEHLNSIDDAVSYAGELLNLGHNCIVAEQKLEGEEFSLQTISDGESFVHCPLVQDHKRANEGDKGPNTGGMGSYSCSDFSLPFLHRSEVAEAKRISTLILRKICDDVGKPYRGVLYGNYMATAHGVKLIEYNARFADPESMNVLPIMEADFVEVCEAVVKGTLSKLTVNFRPKATVCKYVVPEGYPANPEREKEISVPEELLGREELRTYFAAVNQRPEGLFLTGSRAVAFVGIGDTLSAAEELAELAASSVRGPLKHRRDIGSSSLIQSRIDHMRAIREQSSIDNRVFGLAGAD
jgi:phosphoribosylamine---glycine ligase